MDEEGTEGDMHDDNGDVDAINGDDNAIVVRERAVDNEVLNNGIDVSESKDTSSSENRKYEWNELAQSNDAELTRQVSSCKQQRQLVCEREKIQMANG